MPIFSHNKIFSCGNKVFKTPWSPSRISDLIFWSDASYKNLETDTINRISKWKDISGNKNNAIQTLNIRKPIVMNNIINGYPCIHFQNSLLEIPLHINYFTIFTVINANNKYVYEFGDDINTETGFYLTGDINAIKISKDGEFFSSKKYSDDWLNDGWYILVHQYNGSHSGHRLIINKNNAYLTDDFTDNPGNLNETKNLNLGAKSDATYGINGYIPEFLVYNRYLSLNEIFTISDWLNNKYQIY